jgi:hypothetical protein
LALISQLGGHYLQGALPDIGILAGEQAGQGAEEHRGGKEGETALQHLFRLNYCRKFQIFHKNKKNIELNYKYQFFPI